MWSVVGGTGEVFKQVGSVKMDTTRGSGEMGEKKLESGDYAVEEYQEKTIQVKNLQQKVSGQ